MQVLFIKVKASMRQAGWGHVTKARPLSGPTLHPLFYCSEEPVHGTAWEYCARPPRARQHRTICMLPQPCPCTREHHECMQPNEFWVITATRLPWLRLSSCQVLDRRKAPVIND